MGKLAIEALALALLAGCASHVQFPPPARYACEGGRTFTLYPHASGETATLELNQMVFGLRREPTASGVKYACDVLSVSARGDEATLEMEGRAAYSGCRLVAERASRPD